MIPPKNQATKPKRMPEPGFWPYRPGYNHHIGFADRSGKPINPRSTVASEWVIDRIVKEGVPLNK